MLQNNNCFQDAAGSRSYRLINQGMQSQIKYFESLPEIFIFKPDPFQYNK